MRFPPLETLLALAVVGAAGIVSVLAYRRRDGSVPVRDTQPMASCRVARWLNRLVRPFVALILITSFVYDGPWLLVMHKLSWLRWCGAGLAVAGIGMLVWAFRTLNEEYNPCTRAYLPKRIITTGPYRWVRHPIYVANLLFLTGTTLATASCWLLIPLIAFTAVYLVQSKREERALALEFPEYQEYVRRTSWLPRWMGQ